MLLNKIQLITVFFILTFQMVANAGMGEDITVYSYRLKQLLPDKQSTSVKNHLMNAIAYSNHNMVNSFREEMLLLSEIDKESSVEYKSIINELEHGGPTQPEPTAITGNPGLMTEYNVLDAKIAKADDYYSKSKIPETKAAAQDILQLDPNNADAKNLLASVNDEVFLQDENKPFQETEKQYFDDGIKAYRAGDYKVAEEKLNLAAELDADNRQISKYQSIVRQKLYLTKQKVSSDKLTASADLMRNDGNIKEARELYLKAAAINPNDITAKHYLQEFEKNSSLYLEKAKKLEENKEVKQAIEECSTALKYNPENTEAVTLSEKLEFEYAKIESNSKERKKLTDFYNRGTTAYDKGEYEKAIKYWKAVISINPDDSQAKKNIEKAKAKLDEIGQSKEKTINKSLKSADSYFKEGFLEKAKNQYEYVLRLEPQNEEAAAGLDKIDKTVKKKDDETINTR